MPLLLGVMADAPLLGSLDRRTGMPPTTGRSRPVGPTDRSATGTHSWWMSSSLSGLRARLAHACDPGRNL